MMKKTTIIGGSVSGCLSALMLKRKAYDVQIFERSTASLNDRGAAIVIPAPLFKSLKELDLIDANTPHLNHKNMHYCVKRKPDDSFALWDFPTDVIALRWGHLYQQLRKRVDDKRYHQGISVSHITDADDHSTVTLDNGQQHQSDLIIAADGIHSYGREYVCGEHQPHYSGYILWRGLIDEQKLATSDIFKNIYWSPFNGGIAGAYFIANQQGETAKGQRSLNWGIYKKLPADQLQALVPELSFQKPTAYHLDVVQ
jgi:2-polyprenyl-6-methoxyphenol hydroxylase-like FAD-dependent oxidoreductase